MTKTRIKWFMTTRGEVLVEDISDSTANNDDGMTIPPQALLSTIVYITEDDFWLSSDGYWKGPTQYCQTLADLKITCTGRAPHRGSLKREFATAIQTLEDVMRSALTEEYKIKPVTVHSAATGEVKIKFRHKVFEVSDSKYWTINLSDAMSNSQELSESSEETDDFMILNPRGKCKLCV
jgi:hypothetical protein